MSEHSSWWVSLIPPLGLLLGLILGLIFKRSPEEERERYIYQQQMRHNEEYLSEKP